ncbi:MAG: hypothetical protein IPH22_08760 [Nitrosomonas sp.]|nr:hypothetical protein [Nitrosomonas sp.]
MSGITKDSIYRIFSGSQKVSESLPEVQIISTEPFSSEAKILKGSIKAGDILVESQHAYNFKPIRIAIEGDSTLRQIQKQNATDLITKKLNSSGLFELANGRQEEGWIVYLLQPDKKQDGEYNYAPNTTLPISNPDAPMEAWVLNMVHPASAYLLVRNAC